MCNRTVMPHKPVASALEQARSIGGLDGRWIDANGRNILSINYTVGLERYAVADKADNLMAIVDPERARLHPETYIATSGVVNADVGAITTMQ